MDFSDLLDSLRHFAWERDWAQLYSPANLAKSISIEAGELLECFQWGDDASEERVREELADVLTYCPDLCDRICVDPADLVAEKLEVTKSKYPADRVRGKSLKDDQYPD